MIEPNSSEVNSAEDLQLSLYKVLYSSAGGSAGMGEA